MLTKIALESARELADVLEKRRIQLEPIEGSPLDLLVRSSQPVLEVDKPQTVDQAVESLEVNSLSVDETNLNNHDAVSENINAKIVGLIDRRLYLARSVINPIVKKYAEIVVNDLMGVVPQQPEVVPVDFGEFYDNPMAREIFKGFTYNDPGTLYGVLGIELDDSNNYYLEALSTGSEFIDAKLTQIIQTRGIDWVKDIAVRYFNRGEEIPTIDPSLRPEYQEALDRNLIIHFYARYFFNKEYPLTKESPEIWRLNLSKILGRTSNNIQGLWVYRDDLDRRNTVHVQPSTEAHRVFIYKPTYDLFKMNGGSDTAIMGYAKHHRGILSVEALLEKKDEVEELYDNAVNKEIRDVRASKINLIKRSCERHLPDLISELPTDAVNTIPALINQDLPKVLYFRGKEWINNPAVIDPDNVYQYVQDLICKGLLPELDLSSLYAGIEKYTRADYGTPLTPAQAVYYVVLEEVVRFYLSQTAFSGQNKVQ